MATGFGNGLYSKTASLLFTGRGSEFETWSLFEQDREGLARSRVFYCGPQQPQQKPYVENTRNYIRGILPNGLDLGFPAQELVELMFPHVNSTPRRSLNGRTPSEMFSFLYGDEALKLLMVEAVPRDEAILMPYLLARKTAES
ncbi:MAG: hypothetical protein FWG10_02775 [Eubacteriaceae bacterium]|nr:hypothetical protein [Eubacteriaceae bacterium]